MAYTCLQYFDNLVDMLVDTFFYLTPLGSDIVVFLLVDLFSNEDKERLQSDGENYELWFKGLCSFAAAYFKKVPEPLKHNSALFEFVVQRLRKNSCGELNIISELISSMSGITVRNTLNETQMLGQAGGPLLRAQILDKAAASLRNSLRHCSETLKKCLLRDADETKKSGTFLDMILLTIHHKNLAVYDIDNDLLADVRIRGNVFDRCQDIFLQLIEFLCVYLTKDEVCRYIPSTQIFCNVKHLQPEDAFLITGSFLKYEASTSADTAEDAGADNDLDAVEEGEVDHKKDGEQRVSNVPQQENLLDFCSELVREHPGISNFLYAAFWSNSLGDLYLPTLQYQQVIADLKQEHDTTHEQKEVSLYVILSVCLHFLSEN
jgi:hypothetical protein